MQIVKGFAIGFIAFVAFAAIIAISWTAAALYQESAFAFPGVVGAAIICNGAWEALKNA